MVVKDVLFRGTPVKAKNLPSRYKVVGNIWLNSELLE